MQNPFEKIMDELSNLIYIYLQNRNMPNEPFNILDWSADITDTEVYYNFCQFADESELVFKLPINNYSFDKREIFEDNNLIKFIGIDHKELKYDYYDIVLIREFTEDDNDIVDVIKNCSRCLKPNGLLYFNLVLTENIEVIFETAIKNGLSPLTITSIKISENGRPEFTLRNDGESFKKLVDMHGYIQICFIKKECSHFLFTQINDKELYSKLPFEPEVYQLKSAGIWKVDQALTGREYIDDCEVNLIEFSDFIKSDNLKQYIEKVKSHPHFPETTKIFFSDYLEADMPHHTELSELDTTEYYYLSSSEFVHTMIDNIINEGCKQIPELILRHVSLNHLCNNYTLIDKNGNVIDENKTWTILDKNGYKIISQENCDERNAIELNSLNNLFDANIDIQATLLYNLIRIKPKGKKLSLLYLKKYFYTTDYELALENVRNLKNSRKLKYNSVFFLLWGQEKTDAGVGLFTVEDFPSKYLDNPNRKNDGYGGFSVEEVNNSYIYIDDFKNHEKIIEDFKLKNDTSLEKYKIKASKRFSDILFFDNLKTREKTAKELYDIDVLISLLGTEKQLASAEMNYEIIQQTYATEINMMNFYTAIEKYLRLCIACHSKRNQLETGVKSIHRIDTFTLGELYYCCSSNTDLLFDKKDNRQTKELLSYLKEIKNARNTEAHTGKGINKDDAENWIIKIYTLLDLINNAFIIE